MMQTGTGDAGQRYQRDRARQYDHDPVIRWAAGVRRRAVEAMNLQPGQTVVDIACGTGLNLAALRAGVGAAGCVIGIDMSSEMLAVAQGRVRGGGWQNVELINAGVGEASLSALADAALFSFTHDILYSPDATRAALEYLRPGARVVACGAMQKWFPGRLGWWLPTLISRRYAGDREPMERPWDGLTTHLEDVEARRLAAYLGTMYLCVGRTPDPGGDAESPSQMLG
jgi:SAM-dependent methyltransferase